MRRGIAGLYAVTPETADTRSLVAGAEAALAGGARLLQYRNKSAAATLRLAQAGALLASCRQFRVPFIVNDYLDLALNVDADGLHLGAEDGSLAKARERLGAGKILGASCYDRLELALEAERLGADYVAFGSFFPSAVKPGAARAPLGLLGEARRRLSIPIVAIGGITLDNAPKLIAAGSDALAVVSALFTADDVELAARRFCALFAQDELAERPS
jgi:thiamine-phosphate pyrophosphorylase